MNRLPAVVIVAAVGLGLPTVAAAQHVQCHTDTIGSTTYTDCDGPPQPHGGTDPSFILRGLSDGPAPVDPLAIALQAAQLRAAKESALLLAEQRRLLAAQREALAAHAEPAAAVVAAPGARVEADDRMPAPTDGHWWHWAEGRPRLERLAMVAGLLSGAETGMTLAIADEAGDTPAGAARHAALVARLIRQDLTYGQIIAKLDGYYADPTTIETSIGLAFVIVMAPPSPSTR